MPEFQPQQRVRVREDSRLGARPEQRFLGKEGTILECTGTPLGGGVPMIYLVELDGGEVEPFTPDWLEAILP